MKKKIKVCWLSAGVSSFIAGFLEKETIDKFIYIDVEDQHPDSMRFIRDCEKALGKEVEILHSPYKTVENVAKTFGYVNGPYGARCTSILKKRVRKEWEYQFSDYEITYVWGFDYTEKHRAENMDESMPQFHHQYPLIERMLLKADTHQMLAKMGIKRPYMYDLGYPNNNCIGCVKGGKGYWNKIRVDFPDVFAKRAKMEREIGHSCINGIFLDELPPTAGRMEDEIIEECGIMCQLQSY